MQDALSPGGGPHFLRRELERRWAQLLPLLDDHEVDIGEIAGWVQRQELVAEVVLRIANSPTNHLRREIREVRHAIALLGLNRLREFAVRGAAHHDLTGAAATFEN